MPVFNREMMVADAIRSIRNQTFQDWELIILDDASTDGTLEVCKSFQANDDRIRVFANPRNLGVGETRNRLLFYASGKYIAVQDSDDTSLPERLAWEAELLDAKPEIGLVTGLVAMLDDADRILTYYPQRLFRGEQFPQDRRKLVELAYLGSGLESSSYMFRRSLVENLPNPYGSCRIVDDWYFFVCMAHRTLMWGIPKVMVLMRRGKSHAHLGKDHDAAQLEAFHVRRSLYQRYKSDPDSSIDFGLYRRSIASSLLWRSSLIRGWRGSLFVLKAIAYDPLSASAWLQLRNFLRRGFRKGKSKLFRRILQL
jgi:glycosyltransferase involved in cell wall biosynthesis